MYPGFSYFGVRNQQNMARVNEQAGNAFYPHNFAMRRDTSAPGAPPPGFRNSAFLNPAARPFYPGRRF